MYNGILHAHSGWRWIVLGLLLATVILSLIGWLSKKDTMSNVSSKIFKFNTIAVHIQLVFGLVLLFVSNRFDYGNLDMENGVVSYFLGKHTPIMIVAVILVTIGGAMMKRQSDVIKKHRTLFIFNFIALLLVLSMIPWPSMGYNTGWF